ncbi:MAG: DUF1284 domain-containing protein [Dethiobacter sp.]|jgi:hypothetical protein|nr:MAG: DUF1284 domain-containing protein [Dethiobacter sp.]
MLIIRGHHLLCLRYFQGKGYSKKFVEKMGGIESSLKSNPRQKIVVINSCDAICDSGECSWLFICLKNQASNNYKK